MIIYEDRGGWSFYTKGRRNLTFVMSMLYLRINYHQSPILVLLRLALDHLFSHEQKGRNCGDHRGESPQWKRVTAVRDANFFYSATCGRGLWFDLRCDAVRAESLKVNASILMKKLNRVQHLYKINYW